MTTPPDDRPDPEETRPLASPSGDQPGLQSGDQPSWAPYTPPFDPTSESPSTPAPPPTHPGRGWSGPAYPPAPPGYGQVPYASVYPQSHSGATTSMALGITATSAAAIAPFLCCLSLPLTLTGPFAIVIAVRSMRQIDARPGEFRNRGNATAGLVTGIVGTVLGAAMLLLMLLFLGSMNVNLYG